MSRSHPQTTCQQICTVLKGSRPTCNPRGHVSAHSHTLFTRVRRSTQCCTCRLCLHAAPSWKGRCHTPGIPMLLWKQGSHISQWEGRDYDMCVCAWESNSSVSLAACWQGEILISSLKEKNMLGNNTRIKQKHAAKPIKNQQYNLVIISWGWDMCVSGLFVTHAL